MAGVEPLENEVVREWSVGRTPLWVIVHMEQVFRRLLPQRTSFWKMPKSKSGKDTRILLSKYNEHAG